MKHSLLFMSLLLLASSVQAQQALHGRVVDATSGDGVPLVNVGILGTTTGTVTDDTGHFMLPLTVGTHALRMSALGYASLTRTVVVPNNDVLLDTLQVRLHPAVLLHEEVVVQDQGALTNDLAAPSHKLNATEDLVDRIPGADFIQRANFAWEPVIRGMNGGQVGLVIDGIKVIGACVDKMDPTSAYVEVENLEKLELTKGGFDLTHASQIGGAVNLVTQKPRFDRPFHLDAELGYESVSALQRVRVAGGAAYKNTSFRGSFSYKRSGDFAPGGQDALTNSGYEKNNYKLDLAQRLGKGHRLTASFLADNAWDIGYPVLLMDATLAQAKIYSLTHNWETKHHHRWLHAWETRLYHNTVDHWMDDFERDVAQREVMRAMYMPMYGYTRTSGGLSRVDMHIGKQQLSMTLDAYRTESFGDMWMFSLFPTIPDMYLLNLGDIEVQHGALVADWSLPVAPKLNLRTNVRYDYSWRDVKRAEAQAVLQGRWNREDLARTYAFPNASVSFAYMLQPATQVRLSLANVGRLPTHVENYGHYVYNYVDGYFYTGNPGLKPERSSQVELSFERTTSRFAFRVNAFYNYIQDYIVGQNDDGLVGGSSTFRFRVYRNASAATLMGGEFSGLVGLTPRLELAGTAAYSRGHNLDVDEPLPLIPPLFGTLSLRYTQDNLWGEVEARGAAPQNRVAAVVAQEDGTDGYFVLNLRGSYLLPRGLELKGGIENVFDYFYHEHLSFGNLPSRGRNLYLALALSL